MKKTLFVARMRGPFHCPYCFESFPTYGQLAIHKSRFHYYDSSLV